ncbi:HAMP domain-containing sensor histidine kinase [Proteiniborus sp. MB09-C3]|uniref:sensor histidine kinase n=1 Tax=Proteiniborus sp. MB09-C3 TaxID=3050072 RepID=UPI00255754D6|nr:HAMP domain-containing sensor histidine kinase [Proteiniborus sp. MB09-C3]WIV13757.1 HAMP domain-containing sensor histidine kinase [Proteiniborus sp. MB09-C3]
MIKKYKSSLTTKIFLLTMLLLTICCIATYAFIAWLIPKTYPNQVDLEAVKSFADNITEELKHVDYDDIMVIAMDIEKTAQDRYGDGVELHIFDKSGLEVFGNGSLKKDIKDYYAIQRTREYRFTFADNTEEFTFFFADGSQAVNYAVEAVNRIFPYLIVMVLVISIFAAFVYSRYITYPIVKISKASKKMIALDFDLNYKTSRTDELGTVYHNLSALAEKLSFTLKELEKTNAQLSDDINRERQLEQQRTELFSAISHELKTPITIVKGQLQGMISGIGRYKDRDTYLIQSLQALNGLETMVQELLIISRMEAPEYVCSRKPFDLALLVKQCLIAQEDAFIQNEMQLNTDLPDNVIYNGDIQLLKRVFDNLIINALKYSPAGNRVSVSMTTRDESIYFSIENTGTHIAEEDLSRIFEAFYRPDHSRSRQTGGSGLGLYIVKRVLDMHEAKYGMENSKDGVIFTIMF